MYLPAEFTAIANVYAKVVPTFMPVPKVFLVLSCTMSQRLFSTRRRDLLIDKTVSLCQPTTPGIGWDIVIPFDMQ